MDLLKDDVKKIYYKYLVTTMGGAFLPAIYSLADFVMTGHYEGPNGTAALATVSPIWNIVYSLGMLFGIGGSVLMSASRGAGDKNRADQYFTISAIGAGIVSAVVWVCVILFDDYYLRFFGADDVLLPLAKEYLTYIKFVIPVFTLGSFMSNFVRNDGKPLLATGAIMSAGIFNVVGDYFFIFICDMGIKGAGLATAMGQCIACCILLTHFFSKKCTMRFVKPKDVAMRVKHILASGFSPFSIDLAMGVLATMFNTQVMKYAGANALAVYGVIINISTSIQCCGYGIGQAVQPLVSENAGAKQHGRILEALGLGMKTSLEFGVVIMGITVAFPEQLAKIYMDITPEVLAIAPGIMRSYFVSFLLLPFNVFATFYFQALLKAGTSTILSLSRSIAISGVLVFLLPAVFGQYMLWWTMPITELITGMATFALIRKSKGELSADLT